MLACDANIHKNELCPKKDTCLHFKQFKGYKRSQELLSAFVCVSDTLRIDNHVYPKNQFSEYKEVK